MEIAPTEGAEAQAKFAARRNKALAIIVLVIEPSLLYLTGTDPINPVVVFRRHWLNSSNAKLRKIN